VFYYICFSIRLQQLTSSKAKQHTNLEIKASHSENKSKKKDKTKKTRPKGKKNYAESDTTPCSACSMRFCDDNTGRHWTQCQQCKSWYHNACQGLTETGVKTFVCISCDDESQNAN